MPRLASPTIFRGHLRPLSVHGMKPRSLRMRWLTEGGGFASPCARKMRYLITSISFNCDGHTRSGHLSGKMLYYVRIDEYATSVAFLTMNKTCQNRCNFLFLRPQI